MKTKCVVMAGMMLLASSVGWAGSAIDAAIDEANAGFTFQGKPIHPGLVEEFAGWISDSGRPTTVSVDLLAEHGNEYYEGYARLREDGYLYHQKEGVNEFFRYKWLGRLENGLHVLSAAVWTGGSGVFERLYFVRFEKGEGFDEDGTKYDRLLMTVVRHYGMGDRDHADIQVLPDRVVVGKSEYRDAPVTLTFSKT